VKKTIALVITLLFAIAGLSANTADTALAARVNGDPVTWDDVKRLLATPAERQLLLKELGSEDGDSAALDKLAVRTLIRRRLILQEAERRTFTITEGEIDKAVTSLRRRFSDLKALGLWMREQGVDEKSLFDTVRADLLAARVRAAVVANVGVTDEETQKYYDAHKDDLKLEEVRLQIIVAKEEAAAREILAAIQKGENFGALAAERSVGVRAARGGDTGWVNAETLWRPLGEAVARMAPRQAHGPLQRDNEFLIVRLDGRRTGRGKTLTEAVPEITRRLLPGKQRAAIEAWLADQETKSTIEIFPQPE
jgi:parvulin-like peptidyl-prolyl isomerase